MEEIKYKVKKLIKSNEGEDFIRQLKNNMIGAISFDSASLISLTEQIIHMPHAIMAVYFLENFKNFLNGISFNPGLQVKFIEFINKDEKKEENVEKIVKFIDKVDSKKKCDIFINLTKAVSFSEIYARQYYRLMNILEQVSSEDIHYIEKNIEKSILNEDEYTDDFIAYGLIYQSEIGLSFNVNAHMLFKFGISYGEKNHNIPSEFKKRLQPLHWNS